jgi:hypothetical protein
MSVWPLSIEGAEGVMAPVVRTMLAVTETAEEVKVTGVEELSFT